MQNLSRRRAITLGAALGLAGALPPAAAWAWSSAGSIAGTDTVTDPWNVWDDATDPLVAALLDGGRIPAVNTAFQTWVDNGDPLPAGLPTALVTYLQQYNRLPAWADPTKLAAAATFNKREFVRYVLGDRIGDWLRLPRDLVARTLIELGWPAYVAFQEGLSPIVPAGFDVIDRLVRALAMLFLNNGTSPTYTPITIPTGNRPGA